MEYGLDVLALRLWCPFPVRAYEGDQLLLVTPTVVVIQCHQRTNCLSQWFGRYAERWQGEEVAETWLLFSTQIYPPETTGPVSVVAGPLEEVLLITGDRWPCVAHSGIICRSRWPCSSGCISCLRRVLRWISSINGCLWCPVQCKNASCWPNVAFTWACT